MSDTSLFNVSSSDIMKKITPVIGSADVSFTIGASGDMSDADCLEVVLRAEDKLKANIDPKYRRLLTHVDGEILSECAAPSQTTFPLSFESAYNVKVYVDFPEKGIGWTRRNHTHETDLTWTAPSGAVVFASGLPEGSTVFAEYDHADASGIRMLKNIVEDLSAVEISRRNAYFRVADGFNRFLDWENRAERDLAKLRNREIGIPQFDDINLVYDDTDGYSGNFYQSMARL